MVWLSVRCHQEGQISLSCARYVDGAKINVCSDGDQPADDRRRLEADPERRLCPEQGGVGLAVSEPYTQGPFLPSTRQTADVWQMPRDFLMLSSLYLFHR